MINLILGDCMDLMRSKPDKFYDLAIVDPPYGIGISSNPVRQQHDKKEWDNQTPTLEYFDQLFRVSKNQIIWGGNYFNLPPTQNLIVWDKKQPFDFSLAMCEFAWCSMQMPAKIWRYSVLIEKNKIHPTQKPIELYKWILNNYAKEGQKILDTHGGSFSHAIAAYDLGFDLDIIELDPDYYRDGKARFDNRVTKCEEIKSLGYAKSEISKINPILF